MSDLLRVGESTFIPCGEGDKKDDEQIKADRTRMESLCRFGAEHCGKPHYLMQWQEGDDLCIALCQPPSRADVLRQHPEAETIFEAVPSGWN